MKKRSLFIGTSLLACLGITMAIVSRNPLLGKVYGDNNPYLLDLNRNITTEEINAGQASFSTANGNSIVFKFDSSKSTTGSGLLNMATGDFFFNETAITGINNIDVTLSGGSATLTYGNDKNFLNLGSETLNTGGNNNVLFSVPLNAPSNYFKLDITGSSLLNRLKISYSCSNEAKTPLTILFQGDSITDNSRSRSNLNDLGGGYAFMVSQKLQQTYGDRFDFTFLNRANGGWNLIDNWNEGGVNHYEEEFYQYNADITTILIGYNDIMDYVNAGGVSDADFESCYRELLEGLTLRGTKPVCMAPFDLNAAISEYRTTEFAHKKQIVQDLAEEFNTEFIDMGPYMHQAVADGAYRMELFGDWTHPWAAGNRIICDLVVDKISHLIDEEYQTPADLGTYRPLVPTTSDNDEDYTNYRAFFGGSFGKMEYDYSTFYDSVDFASSKSLKATHENPNPVNANAYMKVLFDFSDAGIKDLSSGTLSVNLKIDNLVPRIIFKAHSGLARSTYENEMSPEYGVSLTDPSKVEKINEDWYRITINLNAWSAEDSNHVLNNAVGLSIITSKGESDSARTTHGVDGTKDSIVWIDNLRFDLQQSGQDYHVAKESFAASVSYQKLAIQKDYNKLSFEYQITNGGTMCVVACDLDDWNVGYGKFFFDANGPTSTYTNLEYETLEDGWIGVSILLNKQTKMLSTIPTQVCLFRISGSNTTANGYVDHISFSKVFIPRGVAFNGDSYSPNIPDIALTETVIIDFFFTTANNTYFSFNLREGWDGGYLGTFVLYGDGKLGDNYAGVTAQLLEDGYFRITMVLSQITKGSNIDSIQNITMFHISGGSSTARGYVDFNPTEEPETVRGTPFFADSSVTLALSPTLSLTDTFVVDIGFTTASTSYVAINLRTSEWANYFGTYRVYANGTLGDNYHGVSIQLLEDGYYRITFDISQLDIGGNIDSITEINTFHISASNTTADGYYDINPTI